MKQYNFYITPSHGYLEIDLNEYPNILELVSGYSYLDRQQNLLYCEEDQDASKVIKALGIKDEELFNTFDDEEDIKTKCIRLDQLGTV